jgi:hypothetical protein
MRNEGENNGGPAGKTMTRSTKTMISPWVSEVKRFSTREWPERERLLRESTISLMKRAP